MRMIKRPYKYLLILLLTLILSTQTFGFALNGGTGVKQRTGEEIRIEMMRTIENIQKIRLDIANQTEKIRLRIGKLKRVIAVLLKDPEQLEDKQINALKAIAVDLKETNTTLRQGQDDIKAIQLKLKEAIDAKDRKAALSLYRDLFKTQKIYLLGLQTINQKLLTDLETVLEIKNAQ